MIAFDNQRYLEFQKQAFEKKFKDCTKLYLEVGGKLIQDKHATRVLPGYDENQKMNFIKNLFNNDFELIYAISFENIVNQKIRDDFSTSYTEETFRLIKEFKKFDVEVKNIVITKYKEQVKSNIFDKFVEDLKKLDKNVFYLYYMDNYSPSEDFFITFNEKQKLLKIDKKNIVVTGPGGGSGKFAFCLSQIFNEMKNGEIPQYIKYESFPVHNLDIKHPLNLAYMASTIDLKDKIFEDKYQTGSISYNRDIENFELLKFLSKKFEKEGRLINELKSPTDMGINFIKEGIIDDEAVREASSIEIFRRFLKHKKKYLKGQEDKENMNNIRKIIEFVMDN